MPISSAAEIHGLTAVAKEVGTARRTETYFWRPADIVALATLTLSDLSSNPLPCLIRRPRTSFHQGELHAATLTCTPFAAMTAPSTQDMGESLQSTTGVELWLTLTDPAGAHYWYYYCCTRLRSTGCSVASQPPPLLLAVASTARPANVGGSLGR